MLEELAQIWEDAETIRRIRNGDEFIRKESDDCFVVARSTTSFSAGDDIRLIKSRVPQVPDDLLVISAVPVNGVDRSRRPLFRGAPGDTVWYSIDDIGYDLDELTDIRAMIETGEFL